MPWTPCWKDSVQLTVMRLECYEANVEPQQLWEMTATNTGHHVPLRGVNSSSYALIPRHFSLTILTLRDSKKTWCCNSKNLKVVPRQTLGRADFLVKRPLQIEETTGRSQRHPTYETAERSSVSAGTHVDSWQVTGTHAGKSGGHHRRQGRKRRCKNVEIAGCSH